MGIFVAKNETEHLFMKTEDIALFHRIVEKKSINDTASLLNIPKSTISRRLKSLEEELSIKLFHRHGREMIATTAGERFYSQTVTMISQLEHLISDMNTETAPLYGKLRIQMLPIPKVHQLYSIIFKFIELHPDLNVELIATSEPLDMVKHNLDVAFRIDVQIEDADLVARKLFNTEIHFFASPEYIKEFGSLTAVEDLTNHNNILYRFINDKVINDISEFSNLGNIKVKGNLVTNSISFAKMAAVEGKGIACLPLQFVADEIASGTLVKVLPEMESVNGTYNIVYPSRAYLSTTARRFIDFVLEEVKSIQFDMVDDKMDDDFYL